MLYGDVRLSAEFLTCICGFAYGRSLPSVLSVVSDNNTMAATTDCSKKPELSKAEYLKRYLSADEDVKKSKGKLKKKRRKVAEKG